MEPESPPIGPSRMTQARSGPDTEQLPIAADALGAIWAGRRRRKVPWTIVVVVVVVAAIVLVITDPFAVGSGQRQARSNSPRGTGLYTVTRRGLSSQTQVAGTLGYAGTYTIVPPSGASAQQVAEAQQAVAEDRQALTSDEQSVADTSTTGDQQVAAAQADVNAASATLRSDQAKEAQDCTGTGAASAVCDQDTQKVSEDQTALTQASQQLASSQASAASSQHQAQAKVAVDQVKLAGDQTALTSLQATAVNPGTTYTSLPNVGATIEEDQPVYSVSDEPVPLLYGSIPAYRAFTVGMSDGTDVGELNRDLIALGFGTGLTQSNHYSTATAAAVGRWQAALGLPQSGGILLGQVVFEPGPIRVTSVAASVGQPVASTSGGGGGGAAGGAVLVATSTTRQVSIALDTSQQSQVAAGDKVTITLPDNQTTPGVVSSVGTVATAPPSSSAGTGRPGTGGGNPPTVTVLVEPTDPAATGTWDEAPVDVTITTGRVVNVLVVPVAALLAQTGGRYAVQVAGAGGAYRLVRVRLGLFDDADGLVQVTGSGLAAGQRVVVPAA